MTTNLLTPLLDEYDRELAILNARHRSRLNDRVALARTNILAELAGVTAATPTPHPRSKAKAKRPRGK